MRYLQSYFKSEIHHTRKTRLTFTAYKEFVESNRSLYCTETAENQLSIEWKVSRGTYLVAVCIFEPGNLENMMAVTVKSKPNVIFHKYILILWGILGGFWLLAEPGTSSLLAIMFGSGVLLAFWDFTIVNRQKLLDILTPE